MSRLTKVALSTARRAGALALALAAVPALGLSAGGCEAYEGAPRAIIANADKGILADRKVPLVVEFDKPVVLGTVKLKVVRLIANAEGDLGDEERTPRRRWTCSSTSTGLRRTTRWAGPWSRAPTGGD